MEHFIIQGATYAEASCLVSTVLTLAKEHSEQHVVCLLDQNMDSYKEGKILGTQVTEELRSRGFGGMVFIVSANDDLEAINSHLASGAGNLARPHCRLLLFTTQWVFLSN